MSRRESLALGGLWSGPRVTHQIREGTVPPALRQTGFHCWRPQRRTRRGERGRKQRSSPTRAGSSSCPRVRRCRRFTREGHLNTVGLFTATRRQPADNSSPRDRSTEADAGRGHRGKPYGRLDGAQLNGMGWSDGGTVYPADSSRKEHCLRRRFSGKRPAKEE